MNISGIGSDIFHSNSIFAKKEDDEKKKTEIQKQLEKVMDNLPENKNTEDMIKDIEQKQHDKDFSNVSDNNIEASQKTKSNSSTSKNNNSIVRGRRFDEFVKSENSENQISAGTYSVSKDESGHRKVNFDKAESKDNLKNVSKETENKVDNENNLEKSKNENNDNNNDKSKKDNEDDKIVKYKTIIKTDCHKMHRHGPECNPRVVYSGPADPIKPNDTENKDSENSDV